MVSPPAIQLAPGATQTNSVAHVARTPVSGEEAHRVVLNEIPDQSRRRAGAVAFATELRILVFFADAGVRPANVRWSLRRSGGATHLVAQNTGDSRLRIADVTLERAERRHGAPSRPAEIHAGRIVDGMADRAGGAAGRFGAAVGRD